MAMMTRKRLRTMAESTAESPSAVLSEELMIEILSRVEVNNPLQLRCICKWWKSLVVDPQFVKKHLYISFTDISDLASKAPEDMNAFELQLSYAPTVGSTTSDISISSSEVRSFLFWLLCCCGSRVEMDTAPQCLNHEGKKMNPKLDLRYD